MKDIMLILMLIFFVFITGFSASVVRAVIMGIILIFAGLLHRKSDTINSILLTLLILLIYNPFLLLDVGLQLSFAGTLGIVILNKDILTILESKIFIKIKTFLESRRGEHCSSMKNKLNDLTIRVINTIKDALSICFSAQIMIMPIMLIHFNTVSVTFFISNLLAGSIFGITVFLGFITVLISYIFNPLAQTLSFFLNLVLKLLIWISKFSSNLPFSTILVITPNIILVVAYYAIVFCLKSNKRKQLKIVVCIVLIFTIVSIIYNMFPKDLRIYFIDVGQGDSTLVITPQNKKILIDGGGSRDLEGYDVGESVVLPYLLDRGINSLDYVMISHFDADHCNGLIAVLENLNVRKVIISKQSEMSFEYENIIEIIKRKNIPVQIIQKGDRVVLDKYTYLDILYPDFKLAEKDLNNNSIIAKLNYGNFSMLFTGDIEEPAEKYIVGAAWYAARVA